MRVKANGKRREASTTSQTTNQAVAIYARVSTEDQAERETIKTQLDFLRRYVDLHELTVTDEYIDDGISGRLPLGDRPEGRRLLADAECERFSVVLVYNVKRLGRRLRVVLDAHDAFSRCDITLRSATESLDTATPTGKLVFHMLGSFSEFDTDERTELLSLGRARVAAGGRYTGGPIPLGYDIDEHNRFIPSPRIVPQLGITESELVQGLFQRIASGENTLNAEGARLSALGVEKVQRYGGEAAKVRSRTTRWSISSLTTIIHNPMYKGEGKLDSRFAGEVTRSAPALVDVETWQRAQTTLLQNQRLSKKNAKNTYLLRGLIRCAGCGHSYVGGTGNAGGRVYRCTTHMNRRGRTRCEAKILPADWLEEAVWEECRRFMRNPGDALDEARRKLRERMAQSTRFDAERRKTLEALADKETERERVLTLFRRGSATLEDTEAQLDAIAREAGQLREDLESMRAQAALLDIEEAHLTESAALLERLRSELDAIDASNDQARKREVVEAYVRKLTIETRRVGPRKLDADVRLHLRLRPEPIAVANATCWPGEPPWKKSASISRSGASIAASA